MIPDRLGFPIHFPSGLDNNTDNKHMIPPVHIGQRDFPVGALAANRRALLQIAQQAHSENAAVVFSPELALSGYCPDDMLQDDSFMTSVEQEFAALVAEAPPLPFLVGLPWRQDGQLFDAAALIRDGKVAGVYKKVFLPNESVFDERRYFVSGDEPPLVFEAGGANYAVQICADVWEAAQAAKVAKTGADYVLSLNASPFYAGKHGERLHIARKFTEQAKAGLFYCNLNGGQDELIFEGASFYMDAGGEVLRQSPAFAADNGNGSQPCAEYPADDDAVYQAILMGIRDYAASTGFKGAVLGLSGGVDSALVAVAAADALGGENILAVMMPSRHTSRASLEDAQAIAQNIGAEYLTIPIDPLMDAVHQALSPHLQTKENDVTLENVQARLRGQLLMALSNNRGLLLLATGNKSELACGYATLYGDMCGGFAPIKDVVKTKVWALASRRNAKGRVIPPRVIEREPSAELRDNQTDQQTLPPYDQIDIAIAAHVENGKHYQEWTRQTGKETAARFLDMLAAGEHKRRQGAIGPKVTSRAFGRDWRMPIANRYRHHIN